MKNTQLNEEYFEHEIDEDSQLDEDQDLEFSVSVDENVIALNNEVSGHKLYQTELKNRIKCDDLIEEIAALESKKSLFESDLQIIKRKAKRAQAIIDEAESSIEKIYASREKLTDIKTLIENKEKDLSTLEKAIENQSEQLDEVLETEKVARQDILDIQNQKDDLEKEITTKYQLVDEIEEKLLSREQEIEKRNIELNEILVEISDYRAQRQKIKNQYDHDLDQKNELDKNIEDLSKECSDIKVDITIYSKDIESKKGELSEVSGQIEHAKKVLFDTRAQLSSFKEEREILESQIQQSQLTHSKLNKRVDKVMSKHEAAQGQYLKLTEKSSSLQAKYHTLEQGVHEKTELLNKLDNDKEVLHTKIKDLYETQAQLDSDIEQKESTVKSMLVKEKELSSSIDLLKEKKIDFTTSIQELEDQIDKFQTEHQKLELEISKYQLENQGLSTRFDELKSNVFEIEGQLESKKNYLKELEQKKLKLIVESEELDSRLDKQSVKLNGIVDDIEDYKSELSSLNEQRDSLVNDVELIKESLSYKENELELTQAKIEISHGQLTELNLSIEDAKQRSTDQINEYTKELNSLKKHHEQEANSHQNTLEEIQAKQDKATLEHQTNIDKMNLTLSEVRDALAHKKSELSAICLELNTTKESWSSWSKRKHDLHEQIADAKEKLSYLQRKNEESLLLKEQCHQEIANMKFEAKKNLEQLDRDAQESLVIREQEIMSKAHDFLNSTKVECENRIKKSKEDASAIIKSAERESLTIRKRNEVLVANKRMEDVKEVNSQRHAIKEKLYQELENKVDYIKEEIIAMSNDGADVKKIDKLFEDYLFGNEYIHSKQHVKKLVNALKINPKTLNSSKKFWKRFGLSLCACSLLFVIGLYNQTHISNFVSEVFTDDTQVQDGYIKNVEVQRAKKFYRPLQDNGYKETVVDNILYNKNYLNVKLNQDYQNDYAIKLSDFVVGELSLDDFVVIELISKESRLIRDLAMISSKIPVSIKDKKINEMRAIEKSSNQKIKKILKTNENYKRYRMFSKAHFLNSDF